MKKILLLTVLLVFAGMACAEITVEQARSKEQLKSEGFSDALIQVVQKEAGEYNPKPTNKFQKFCFRVWKYIDPAAPEARDEKRHDIKMYPAYSDL